jgi:hypothetical protein
MTRIEVGRGEQHARRRLAPTRGELDTGIGGELLVAH